MVIDNVFIETCMSQYGITGKSSPLPGEIDYNYLIVSEEGSKYILKISRLGYHPEEFDFQEKLLLHLTQSGEECNFPTLISNIENKKVTTIHDDDGQLRKVRLYSWIEGVLWSSYYPKSDHLLYSLGVEAGKLTYSLSGFNHPFAARSFDWNLDQAEWIKNYFHLFTDEQKQTLQYFTNKYKKAKTNLGLLRKSVIHNDVNDNNILLHTNGTEAKVKAIIDFGDAVYSTTINDLAVAVTYSIMGKHDPLRASLMIVKGYHSSFLL